MGQITESAHFANDLGLDSLDTVEVVMAIEEVRLLVYLPGVAGFRSFGYEPACCPGNVMSANHSQYRSSASRFPTRTPTPSTVVGSRPCCAITFHNTNSICPTVDKAVEYILSQPDAN